VFTHGYTGTFTDYTFLFEDLGSRGYVVASVNHTYEATAVEFPNGRLVESVLGSHLGKNAHSSQQELAFAVSVRLNDLKFVVDELQSLNSQANGPFAGRLDTSKVAIAGHSIGGLMAILAMQEEPRFKAGIVLDGVAPDALSQITQAPVLLLNASDEVWSDSACSLWNSLRGARFAVNLKGAEHLTPTDAVWLARGAVKTGTMGANKTIAAVRDYVAAFLDANLLGRPLNPLLTGPSPDYPDASIKQTQSICRAN
jgi:predicted dienelactone hydrolase